MNRQLKFRAWFTSGTNEIMAGQVMSTQDDRTVGQFLVDVEDCCEEHGYNPILMQYVGLSDKNGVEIYEGDILDSYGGVRYEVFWNRGEYMTRRLGELPKVRLGQQVKNVEPLTKWNLMMFEVIGNIHQHPELLK